MPEFALFSSSGSRDPVNRLNSGLDLKSLLGTVLRGVEPRTRLSSSDLNMLYIWSYLWASKPMYVGLQWKITGTLG